LRSFEGIRAVACRLDGEGMREHGRKLLWAGMD
jgi:hypothetical protein